MDIPVYKPFLPEKSLVYAKEALESGWISSNGRYVQLAEERLKEILGVKYVLLVNSGTAAMHLVALCVSRFRCVNRVVGPDSVYVAAWNPFFYGCTEREHIAIDSDVDTWNMKLDNIEQYDDPGTLFLIVHNLGNVIDVRQVSRRCPNSQIVEDNCEGLFGKYGSRHTGTLGLCSAISFFGNKTISCGEGGAFVTNDESLYEFARVCKGQGQSEIRYLHNELGYNYRMTNVQAGILLGQLMCLDEILNKKRRIFEYYRKNLPSIDGVKIQRSPDDTEHSNWMMGARVIGGSLEDAYEFFRSRSIDIRPMFRPLSHHKHLGSIKTSGETAELLFKECFILPSFPELTKEQLERVVCAVDEYARSER